MSEDRTQNLPNDEFRHILTQLTSINTQLDDVRIRLERLEARDYDTKPIWENALKEIADTRAETREGFKNFSAGTREGIESLRAGMREGFGKVGTGMDDLRAGMREGFEKARVEIDAGARRVARQIDVMHRSILEVQAELRYMDDRVTKLEPQSSQ